MNESDRTNTTSRSTSTPVTLKAWAQQQAPHLSEVSNSNPTATLAPYNLVAITDDLEAARAVALDFERTTPTDTDTTMLVLGHAVSREEKHQVDPEGITTHAARRSLIGGLPGAVVVALIMGLGVWFVTENGPATAAAALGGAIFGFYVTAVWSFVIGTGESPAYQQGFVDPDAADAIFVALHAQDRSLVEKARHAVESDDKIQLFELDDRGEQIA